MNWQFLVGISVVTFSLSTLLQRTILKRAGVSPIAFTIIFQFLVGVLILIFGAVSGAEMSIKPGLNEILPNLFLGTFIYSAANVLLAKSLAKTEASKFTIIFSSRVIFTIMAASLFLDESLNGLQFLGTALVLGSIVLVNFNGKNFSLGRADLLAFLAAVTFGIGNVNDRYILKFANIYPYLVFDFVAPSLLLLLFYFKDLPQFKKFLEIKTAFQLLVLCVIYAVSATTFLSALKYGENVSQISVINLTSVIITVILALIILKETDGWVKKIAGAILSFVGLLLLV